MNDNTIILADEDIEILKKQIEEHKSEGYEAVGSLVAKKFPDIDGLDFIFYEQTMIKKGR